MSVESDGKVFVGDFWLDEEGDVSLITTVDGDSRMVKTYVLTGSDAGLSYDEAIVNFEGIPRGEEEVRGYPYYEFLLYRGQTGECDKQMLDTIEPEGLVYEKVATRKCS